MLTADYIRNAKDLAGALKRPEYRVLWTPDAPEYLPKEAASELITAAYASLTAFTDMMGNI